MKPLYLYNPENFDPQQILPPSLHRFADDARYFIHKICVGQAFGRQNKEGFVQLKTAYLMDVMSFRRFQDIRGTLLESGAVVTDGIWRTGRKAMGYKLADWLVDARECRIEVTSARLAKKLRNRSEFAVKNHRGVMRHLFGYLCQLQVDYHRAVSTVGRAGVRWICVAMMQDGVWFLKRDSYGRVHSNLTSIESSVRGCFYYQQESLTEIDICNSQPLFLSKLLYDYYQPQCADALCHSDTYCLPQCASKLCAIELINSYTSKFKNFSTPGLPRRRRFDILPDDALRFFGLANSGRLYEYIAEQAGGGIKDRKAFKEKLFREIFYGRNSRRQTTYSKLFCRLFPTVYEFIRDVKRGDHTLLAKILQRAESSFVIDGVIWRCMIEHPEMPVFTIHDSVLTTPRWTSRLYGLMLDEFNKWGLAPKLRISQCA